MKVWNYESETNVLNITDGSKDRLTGNHVCMYTQRQGISLTALYEYTSKTAERLFNFDQEISV